MQCMVVRGQPVAAASGILFVQKAIDGGFVSSLTPTLAAPAAAGNLLVVQYISQNQSVNAVPTAPSGYTLAAGLATATGFGNQCATQFYKIAAGGEQSVTMGPGNTSSFDLELIEYSGNAASGVLGPTATSDNGAFLSSVTTGSVAATGPGVVVVGLAEGFNSQINSNSWTNGFTRLDNRDGFVETAHQIIAASGTYSTTESWTGGTARALTVIAAYNAA